MLSAIMSNSTSLSEEASVSSVTGVQDFSSLNMMFSPPLCPQQQQKQNKRKRNLPGNPDPEAEVIALSPRSLLATNRFVCEICNKGFQRDQNLQLHRRGHNLPWKLKQRSGTEIRKRVYVCPESTCVHHNPSRALGDLTGIKKHFCRKHGEKKWKCEKCSKKYAVHSDWKAHSKTCGTREYRCDCGTLFSRKDSFITHRAFCDALAEETAKISTYPSTTTNPIERPVYIHPQNPPPPLFPFPHPPTEVSISSWDPLHNHDPTSNPIKLEFHDFHQQQTSDPASNQIPNHQQVSNINSFFQEQLQQKNFVTTPTFLQPHPYTTTASNTGTVTNLSATALLQKAANVGVAPISSPTQAQSVGHMTSFVSQFQMADSGSGNHMVGASISPGCLAPHSGHFATWKKRDRLTRDFLGLTGECGGDANVGDLLSFTRTVDFPSYDRDRSFLRPPDFGFADSATDTWGDC
ncbi:hypothetical protein IFM89_030819 [Coptis chinensis]|uniref:C2H2-type domain-containing protein n=1 Tax=Coptis chinensis TaxID=261450 RepID=A0A835M198_9MAGN|nr:hypothetical protein IFM89_030819 [Coptis chinensis]